VEADGKAIVCTVELYGLARVLAGEKTVELQLGVGATVRDALSELGLARPELVGRVLKDDLSGVTEGHSLALDGTTFVDDPKSVTLHGGERVLILANAAGGA